MFGPVVTQLATQAPIRCHIAKHRGGRVAVLNLDVPMWRRREQ
jgi:hypothetical protein